MALTSRFGLSRVGGDAGGSLTADGFKYTDRDRQVIDRVLSAFETHDHSGGDQLADPTEAPALALDTAQGALAGGRTFYYRVSFVDQYGLESAASPEVAVATPSQVEAPGRPILASTTGGTLTPGLYTYALTSEAGSYETQLGPHAVLQLLNDRTAITLTLPALPAGADSFGVWRQGPEDNGFTKIGSTSASTILDDGSVPADPCACDPDNLPPQENRTSSTNAIVVTAPDAALITASADSPIRRWRIYRATSSGGYGNNSLVAEVTDRDDTTDILATTFIDRGEPLLQGGPLDVSQTLAPTTPVGGTEHGGQVFLRDTDSVVWHLYVDFEGTLTTEAMPQAMTGAPLGFALTDPDNVPWRVTVGTDGVLATSATLVPGEIIYDALGGPQVATDNGSVTLQLDVTNAGVLQLVGDASRNGQVFLNERSEPAAPASGGVLYVDSADGFLKFKGSAGTVTVIAPA